MLTYHAPQMKYWRNMNTESLNLMDDWDGTSGAPDAAVNAEGDDMAGGVN
jgi:hypothetical protein